MKSYRWQSGRVTRSSHRAQILESVSRIWGSGRLRTRGFGEPVRAQLDIPPYTTMLTLNTVPSSEKVRKDIMGVVLTVIE